MADIFISYSSMDRTAIKRISEFFESQGWTTWWDRQIPVAESFESVLMAELEKSKCVVVVWSKNSVKSPWVKREAEQALQSHKLVPVILGPVKIPASFSHIEAAFPDSWINTAENDEMQNLLNSVSKLVLPESKKLKENRAGWRSWSIRHTYLFIGIFITLIFYVLYLLILKGWGLEYFQILRFAIFLGISAAVLFCLFNNYCINKNIIAPGVSQAKKTSIWLIPVIAFLLNFSLLPVANTFRIYGNIQSKDGHPVNGAQISVDGTPNYTHSLTNGDFILEMANYKLGDKVVLHINHDDFEDIERGINLSAFVIKDSTITLRPIDTSTLTLNHEKYKANP
ncbi:toll/interleukin-1 receptor domain-containing protein [Flavitalea sp.]|nr:toll/interleukin-1 receptor domain-containing protein [Flavitalea sp.]